MVRCYGLKTDGKRCSRQVPTGTKYCWQHNKQGDAENDLSPAMKVAYQMFREQKMKIPQGKALWMDDKQEQEQYLAGIQKHIDEEWKALSDQDKKDRESFVKKWGLAGRTPQMNAGHKVFMESNLQILGRSQLDEIESLWKKLPYGTKMGWINKAVGLGLVEI